jgi:hypothetical protein
MYNFILKESINREFLMQNIKSKKHNAKNLVLRRNAYLNNRNGRFYALFKLISIKGFINHFFQFEM